MKEQTFKKHKEKSGWFSGVFCRRVVSHYALDAGLVSKKVYYMLFNKVIFSRKLKIK